MKVTTTVEIVANISENRVILPDWKPDFLNQSTVYLYCERNKENEMKINEWHTKDSFEAQQRLIAICYW